MVIKTIAAATPSCQGDESSHFLLRRRAVGITDTEFPIAVPFGQVKQASLIYIRVVNDVTIELIVNDTATIAATATLTASDTPADKDTVTIGTITYIFKTVLTGTYGSPYQVLIGGSAAAALDNLKAAVNDGPSGEGTQYGAGTVVNPDIWATDNTDTTQLFEAKIVGSSGNFIPSTEHAFTIHTDVLSFSHTIFTGGADGNMVITLGGPEGTLILFGTPVKAINLLSTATDSSEVDVFIAGTTDVIA
jgi:hypothetical protein